MPTRKALSWRKKISAIVAEGRHSTGLTAIPWRILATMRCGKLGARAHQTALTTKRIAEKR
jgi:hypothetical protein